MSGGLKLKREKNEMMIKRDCEEEERKGGKVRYDNININGNWWV